MRRRTTKERPSKYFRRASFFHFSLIFFGSPVCFPRDYGSRSGWKKARHFNIYIFLAVLFLPPAALYQKCLPRLGHFYLSSGRIAFRTFVPSYSPRRRIEGGTNIRTFSSIMYIIISTVGRWFILHKRMRKKIQVSLLFSRTRWAESVNERQFRNHVRTS